MERVYCGIDFHKRTCTLCFVDHYGNHISTERIQTAQLVRYMINKKSVAIGIEASGGVNHVVQELKEQGHDVRIINPTTYKLVGAGGKKTDEKDARALADGLRMNFAPEVHHKGLYARQIKSLVVTREMFVRERSNSVNHVRGMLREYGLPMPQGYAAFKNHVVKALEKLEGNPIKAILEMHVANINTFETQEAEVNARIEKFIENDERIKRLRTIPGIGDMGSVMCVAVIDDVNRFKDSKHFASYLGLVPRESSSGDKRRLGSITRSGSEILRRYLIHGARAVLLHTKKDNRDANREWAKQLQARVGMNKATVALAHRLARIAYSVLKNDSEYSHDGRAKKKQQKGVVADKSTTTQLNNAA